MKIIIMNRGYKWAWCVDGVNGIGRAGFSPCFSVPLFSPIHHSSAASSGRKAPTAVASMHIYSRFRLNDDDAAAAAAEASEFF